MPVTFQVASHDATSFGQGRGPGSAEDLLTSTWGRQSRTQKVKELLQTSVLKHELSCMSPNRNGFVNAVVTAYNTHHHLVLRPDDVWTAILAQFNFYVNAHAEELRSSFVSHEGKKKLTVTAYGNRYTVDFGGMANQMTEEIHKNVVDKDLKDWILPNFSTTSANDTVICAILMMATLKAYFEYRCCLMCGIPSVTLEGSKADWEKLLSRLDKLPTFGTEPTAWAAMLRPILTRFVNAFDGNPDVDFWSRVCHYHSSGSGPTFLSGWITAFCVWNSDGKWQGPAAGKKPIRFVSDEEILTLFLDGVQYTAIDSADVPAGYCEVDVELDDNGEKIDCMMVSGHMASLVEGENKDTLRPRSSWFMFIKEECEDPMIKMMQGFEEKWAGGAAGLDAESSK